MARRLGLGARIAVLGAFNFSVYLAYVAVIQRSKNRGGSFERDGYEFWNMWLPPRHVRVAQASPQAEAKGSALGEKATDP